MEKDEILIEYAKVNDIPLDEVFKHRKIFENTYAYAIFTLGLQIRELVEVIKKEIGFYRFKGWIEEKLKWVTK
ncbi:hypothetical protein [Evansella tamaricis]|uniref:Uncharacterized protein n=1 Tax=Evansella tamaricis TaxID=2069301 RepID=A0ABS6JL96_9BACI|nr:hypothetical protein [Evansella tamaricis]MBU9714441.1 hypothetical protein [Evansella tamaricis]